MTAEEMAAYLEPPQPSTAPDTAAYYPDESFVLPALIKFGGEATVDDAGHLLYTFPSLQRTAVQVRRRPGGRAPGAAAEQGTALCGRGLTGSRKGRCALLRPPVRPRDRGARSAAWILAATGAPCLLGV